MRETAPESHKRSGVVARSDISLPQSAIAPFYAEMVSGIKAIDPTVRICGYGHIGDGNLHFNLVGHPASNNEFGEKIPLLFDLLYETLARYGGSISAEHGIGQGKRNQLKTVKSAEILDTMQAIKTALDPQNLMNPGKIL